MHALDLADVRGSTKPWALMRLICIFRSSPICHWGSPLSQPVQQELGPGVTVLGPGIHKAAEPQLGLLQPWVRETESPLVLPGDSLTSPFPRPAGAAT